MDEWNWDEIEELAEEIVCEKTNKYIDSPDEGLKLISNLLAFNNEKSSFIRNMLKFNSLVDNGMLEVMGNIGLDKEIEVFNRLNKLKDKMSEQKKIKLLNNKCIIGIGGKFSAGKSKFINSVIRDDILPEDQTPTTSIPTYIIHGEEGLSAYTFNDMEVLLDREAIEALTHAFHKRYNLGFSHIIRSIIIQTTMHSYENVVILDTPGHSKSDANVILNASDEYIAIEHLKTVDFLIWLVDITNGTISEKDINIINRLNIEKPILIVFNKADKEIESNIKTIINETKAKLSKTNLNIYDVVAYSSLESKEYNTTSIESFLLEANSFKNKNEDIQKQIKEINYIFMESFQRKNKSLQEEKKNLEGIIYRLKNIGQLNAIVKLYSANNSYISKNNIYKSKYERVFRNIEEITNELVKNE